MKSLRAQPPSTAPLVPPPAGSMLNPLPGVSMVASPPQILGDPTPTTSIGASVRLRPPSTTTYAAAASGTRDSIISTSSSSTSGTSGGSVTESSSLASYSTSTTLGVEQLQTPVLSTSAFASVSETGGQAHALYPPIPETPSTPLPSSQPLAPAPTEMPVNPLELTTLQRAILPHYTRALFSSLVYGPFRNQSWALSKIGCGLGFDGGGGAGGRVLLLWVSPLPSSQVSLTHLPTYLLHNTHLQGSEDVIVPTTNIPLFEEHIPEACRKTVIIDGAGHEVTMSHGELVGREVGDFLR